jgi:hypothetical protein
VRFRAPFLTASPSDELASGVGARYTGTVPPPTPPDAERCVQRVPAGRCRGRRLSDSDRCMKHEFSVTSINGARQPIDPDVDTGATVELLKDPVYAERVRHWLANPKQLLNWRHTMARAQAMADMLEDKVRRGGEHGVSPPALLAAVDELRLLHLAIAKVEGRLDTTKRVHVSIVDAFVVSTINVLTEFAPPDRLGAALDKFQAFREAVLPGTREARGRESRRYG